MKQNVEVLFMIRCEECNCENFEVLSVDSVNDILSLECVECSAGLEIEDFSSPFNRSNLITDFVESYEHQLAIAV